jgi:hypothetical protein
MEVDHINQSIGAMLPGSTAAIGPAKSERSDQLREIAADPIHAAFYNRRLCLWASLMGHNHHYQLHKPSSNPNKGVIPSSLLILIRPIRVILAYCDTNSHPTSASGAEKPTSRLTMSEFWRR